MPKLKFPQYKVRGKNRDYYVVAFSNYPYMWPYCERFDEEYIIDADVAGWQQLRYAIAILLQAQDRIIYFPTRKNNIENPVTEFYENYDTVLMVAGLHFRRSEWIRLRRQLKPANRVQNFALNYRPEEIAAKAKTLREHMGGWQYKNFDKAMIKEVLSNTAFFCLPEEYYILDFACSLNCEDRLQKVELAEYVGKLGWMLRDETIENNVPVWREVNQEYW